MLTSTVCIALSAAGLAVALLTAYRRRYLAATRAAALALLPVGLYMTGLITLGAKVGGAVGTWAAGLIFKPSVWAGLGVLAVSALLYVGTRFAGRRKGVGQREAHPGVAPAAGAQALSAKPKANAKVKPTARDDGLSDFGEIEDILKRRGI
jgi:hypothetical protein